MKEQEQLQPIIITGLSLQDFKDMLQDSVQIAVNNYFNGNNQRPKQEQGFEDYLTTNEVLKILHLTAPTLIQRDKEGLLHPRYTGKKKLYSKTEVMDFLNNK
jgi:hypothetical protein